MRKITAPAICIIFFMMFCLETAYGAVEIGRIVAIKGRAIIERDEKVIEAKLKDGILFKDIVETREKTRAKMLFIDDSVLTLREKTRAIIKDFIFSQDKGGRSIINLIEGAMRTVVGKTHFEVHTPTAVAASRGTVIDFVVGKTDGKYFTIITCLEGVVEIWSTDPTIEGKVLLTQGGTITVAEGQPLPPPRPVKRAPPQVVKTKALKAEKTDRESPAQVHEGPPPPPPPSSTHASEPPPPPLVHVPPINQPPVIKKVPTTIRVILQ